MLRRDARIRHGMGVLMEDLKEQIAHRVVEANRNDPSAADRCRASMPRNRRVEHERRRGSPIDAGPEVSPYELELGPQHR